MSNKNEQRVNSEKMVVEVREKHEEQQEFRGCESTTSKIVEVREKHEEQRNPNSGLHWKDVAEVRNQHEEQQKKNGSNEQLVSQIRAGIEVQSNMLLLWQQNIGYITKLVNHYKNYAEEEDLQQEGYLGLYEAAQHYDSDMGVKFLSYAGHWIKKRMTRYIKGNGTVRLPEYMQAKLLEYDRVVSKWQQIYNRKPSDAEICHSMNVSGKMLREIEKAAIMGKIGSLDVPVGEDGQTSLCDLQASKVDEEERTVERIRQEELATVLWGMVDSLEGAQPSIIRERYQEGKAIRRIAEEQGSTFEEVRQQEAKGMKELRKPKRSDRLRPFLPDSMIYSSGLCGNGFGRFSRTWTSSTERLALLELERLEKEQKEWMEINRGEQSVHP